MTRRWHWVGGGVAAAVAFYSVLQLFPNEAECVASGGTVDPTHRHCEGPNGYVQLREHVLLHSREPLILILILGGTFLFVQRRRRSRRGHVPLERPNHPN